MVRLLLITLMCFTLTLFSGCAKKVERIGGISGAASIKGSSLPEGTTLTFHSENSTDNFSTHVHANGRYEYYPVQGVGVNHGTYKVTITPPGPPVITQDGMAIPDPKWKEVKLDLAETYRDKNKSPLAVTLSQDPVVFDINID